MENIFTEIINNRVLMIAVLSWAIAQAMKIIRDMYKTKKINWKIITSSGGFPSSHTSFVTALAYGTGAVSGFDSVAFAISTGFAFVVMYDATGVRRAAGHQAKVINKLVLLFEDKDFTMEKKLEELLGHTPFQVAAGMLLGIIVGVVAY